MRHLILFTGIWFVVLSALLRAEPTPTDQPKVDFNRDIRPILAENCFYCHGQDPNKREADLRLDLREAALKSEAFVPGDAAKSALIERIHSTDAETQMPPPKSNRRLSAEQRKLLERWIDAGAEYQAHWAFIAPQRPELPKVEDKSWIRNPIDQFVLAKLNEQKQKLKPSPEADRATLIRRLSIDLIGLPPTPEEVAAFVADQDGQAYEKLVDRLLASPHYGERMALPWLDAARYADSNGYQQDGDTWQWVWRDWVVRAMNEDLPYDKFTIWQLAGDLLPNATEDQKIATGFNRNHLLNGEGGAIAEEQRFVNLFDRIDTTATTWLGLTMACAQCHDHKYDPITQRDYYSLMDAFNRVPETGTPQRFSARIRVGAPFLELPSEAYKARAKDLEQQLAKAEKELKAVDSQGKATREAAYAGWLAGLVISRQTSNLSDEIKKLDRIPESSRTDKQRQDLAKALRSYFDEHAAKEIFPKDPAVEKTALVEKLKKQVADHKADQLPRVMIMSDAKPRQTSILSRGEYLQPTEKVAFATPAFLPPLPKDAQQNRLGLAEWLVSPEHPLTARVQVNRMWQHFFGAGIVRTAEDFGVQSEYPAHGPLLDWLAVEFRERGWSNKTLHRLIVTSATYRQSSRMTPEHKTLDSENRYYARASRFRMPAPLLRDWALASSGLLDARLGGQPVYPYQPDGIWEALAITKERDFTYPASKGKDLYRRSLYTFWRRTVGPANMFDAANRQTCRVRNATTSTPLHALTTLNDPTWVEAARVLAERAMQDSDKLEARLQFASARVLNRSLKAPELTALTKTYERQHALYTAEPKNAKLLLAVGAAPHDAALDPAQHAAFTAVCLGILNLDEALTRE
jgi:hypothetical protein